MTANVIFFGGLCRRGGVCVLVKRRPMRNYLFLFFIVLPGMLLAQGTIKVKKPQSDSFPPFDVPPKYPAGEWELYSYLKNTIRYPKVSREEGIQKTVFISFVVEADGSVTNVRSLNRIWGTDMDDEAIRVIKNMPKWVPAYSGGKPVRSPYSIPIKFSFNGQ
jgi:TonB family protein